MILIPLMRASGRRTTNRSTLVKANEPTVNLRRKRQRFESYVRSKQMASTATPCRVSSGAVGVGSSSTEGEGISELLSHMSFSFPEARKVTEESHLLMYHVHSPLSPMNWSQ